MKESLLARLREEIKRRTDLNMELEEAPHGTLPRFEQKARRWKDERQASRAAAADQLGREKS